MTIQSAPRIESALGFHIERYYDSHPTEKDLMGQSLVQANASVYLRDVLLFLTRVEKWLVAIDYNLYATHDRREHPVVPDVMLFKCIRRDAVPPNRVRSWTIQLPDYPGPDVVFEVISNEGLRKDLITNPSAYERFGVREYFCFDPRSEDERRRYRGELPRLSGWRYPGRIAIGSNDSGWMWSEVLESWLAPDGEILRLYDRNGRLRLTEAEANALAAADERRQAGAERLRADAERRRADAESRRADAEHAAIEQLRARLREAGIDPDQLA